MDRRALAATALTVLLGTATAFAQSSSTSSSSSPSSGAATSTSPRSDGSYGSTGSTSTGSTSGAITPSAPDRSPDNTPRSEGSYGSGDKATSSTAGSTSTDTSASRSGAAVTADTSTAGGATTMTGRDSARSAKLGWMERRFVTKAADSGATELNLAKLAAERATNPEVKSYAQKLVEDHTKVGDELKQLASQKSVELDQDDLGSDRAHKRLSKKSGSEFDHEFVEHMIDMHEADVKMFEKASSDAKDQDLRSFASKHVGHLREHLQQAQSLRSSLMPTGRTDDSSSSSSSTTRGASLNSSDSSSTPAHSSSSSTHGTSSTGSSKGSSNYGTDSTTPSTGSTGSSSSDTSRGGTR